MGSDGSSPRRLTRATEDYEPRWSPDRSKIAFLRYGLTEVAPGVQRFSSYLWTMDADGSDEVSIAETDSFDWSPDGSRIVFGESVDLWTAAPDGTDRTRLTSDVGFDDDPKWSPDGSSIVYTCEFEICVIDSDGGEEVQLTEDPADDYDPLWSPNGKYIAFVTTRDVPENEDGPYHNDLMVMDADGSNERRLTEDCHTDYAMTWMPASSRIVYGTTEGSDSCSAQHDSEVRIVNVEGDPTSRNLTSNRRDDYYPDLSPNGRWIIFARTLQSREGFISELRKMRVSGGPSIALTSTRSRPEQDPDW